MVMQHDSRRMDLDPVFVSSCWDKTSGLVLQDPGRLERGKLDREKRPTGLTGVQPLGRPDVFQILVVSPDEEGLPGPFQPLPPLFEV